MSGLGFAVLAFVFALAVIVAVFPGGALIAVPVAVVGVAAIAFLDFRRRRKQAEDVREFRNEAKAEKVDFTERDKETLASE